MQRVLPSTPVKNPFLMILVAACLLLRASIVWSALVSSDDLFLAPSSVPDGIYDTHYLRFGNNDSIQQLYSNADIGGNLLGVRILPVLNPNPSATSQEGEYSLADLAAINSSNYASYFFRQPNVDYSADLTPDLVSVDYRSSGQYFVEILAENNGVQFTKLFHDQVNDFFMEDPPKAGKDAAGVSRKIPVPKADLYLVSDQDPAYDDKGVLDDAAAILEKAGKKVTRVGSIQATKDAIEKAYKDNGNKKVEVVIVGHGRGLPKGSIKIGKERINNDSDSNMTPEDFQKMIDAWTHSLQLYSCNTGQDKAFIDALKKSLDSVTAFTTTVTWAAPHGDDPGYIDTGATAKKTVETPEPASLLLFFAGLMGLWFAAWRKRSPA